MPSSSVYRKRFGGLPRAYQLVGYLLQNRPAFLSEFQAIAEVKSTLPLDDQPTV